MATAKAGQAIPKPTDAAALAVTRLSTTSRLITSAQNTHNLTVEQIEMNSYGGTVLSVSCDSHLLVGQFDSYQLHVYSADNSHVISITLPDGDKLQDAAWTPRGNIVYSTVSNKVVVMTQDGDVIHIYQAENSLPRCLSVSTDDVIYLADSKTGVYQSTDDGVTWSHVFNVADGSDCMQAIKVSTDSDTDVFWTLELATKYRVRVYTVDKRRVGSNVTWRDVTLPSNVTLDWRNSLAYDGCTGSMFIVDNSCVHVLSVNGQYKCQLVSPQQLTNSPTCVAIDTRHSNVMYVGQANGTVGVFELTWKAQ